MNFDPALLRTFVAVQESKGFTKAAARLHLTQSAVSHQIRRLEEQVGRPLLHRTTRRLALTEDGEEFLRHAEQILHSFDALAQRFRTSPISGSVRFGVPESYMGERLPQVLCQFRRAFPDVRLEASVAVNLDLHRMVLAGELDLAVVPAVAGTMEGILLHRAPLHWVATENFELPREASLPIAFSAPPCICRMLTLEALNATTLRWHSVFTSPSLADLRAAALTGLAIAALSPQNMQPGMKILDGTYGLPPLPDLDTFLIYGEDEPTPAVREFGRLIQQEAAALKMRA